MIPLLEAARGLTDADLAAFVDTLAPEELDLLAPTVPEENAESRDRALRYVDEPPERYAREILGDKPWTRDMRALETAVLDALAGAGPAGIIAIGGNALGKTHALRGIVLKLFDADGSVLGEEGRTGCGIVMTAPTAKSIEGTIYDHLVKGGEAAERRGHILPGWAPRPTERYQGASRRSVLWAEGPWKMEALVAKRTSHGDVAHSLSGRHHHGRQILIGEEGGGIDSSVWAAFSGLAAAANVLTLASVNPTSRHSPLYRLATQDRGAWCRVGFSKLRHPNVVNRRTEIDGAVDHVRFEEALRSGAFEIRGRWPDVEPDPKRLDIVYALPDKGQQDAPGPRPDGIPGHPDAPPLVLRPLSAWAAGQHLDDWLESDESAQLYRISEIRAHAGLFEPPAVPPDRVGLDCHPGRRPWATPAWGPTAWDAIQAKMPPGSIRIGATVEVPWSGTTATEADANAAAWLLARYPGTRFAVDRAYGQVGAALAAIGGKVDYVPFGDPPLHPGGVEGLGPPLNRRAEMALEAAQVLHSGIAVLPARPETERILTGLEAVGPPLVQSGRKIKLREKDEIEQELGRGVDDVDTVWLSLTGSSAGEWGITTASPPDDVAPPPEEWFGSGGSLLE